MEQYTEEQYIAKFGKDAWQEKVLDISDGLPVESVYATDRGNIFMVMTAEE